MGGSVAVTVRKEDSEIIKMARRTGSANWLLFSEKFNYGNVNEAIDDFIKPFSEMRNDYLKGEPYQFHMTPEYGWCDNLSPYGYGLVVLDFQNKKIHSLQGYDTPGFMNIVSIINESHQDLESKKFFEQMITDDNFLTYGQKKEYFGSVKELFGSNISLKKIEGLYDQTFKDEKILKEGEHYFSILHGKFTLKALSDFEIIKYKETLEGLLELWENLTSEGFEFTENEKKEWLDYANDYFIENMELEDYYEEDIGDLSDKEYQEKLSCLKEEKTNKLNVIFNSTSKNKLKI